MDERRRQQTWGRIGGLDAWSRNGVETMLGPARRGFAARFEKAVDPLGILSPEERTRRAERALRAHMLRLAERSAQVRRTRKKTAPASSNSARAAKEGVDEDDDHRQPA